MLTTSVMKQELAENHPYMRMVVHILRAGQIIDHKVSDAIKEFGVTHIQFNVLRILEHRMPEKLSLNDISDGLLFRTSDVSRLVDRLVKNGLVNRTICPDNRRKLELEITDKGLEVIRLSVPKINEALDGFYKENFNEEEREMIIDMMKRIT
jgi:DNA-binding MarR family transcriptional regulator